MISRPHRLTTEGTMPPKWLESTGGRWGRTRCRTCHGTSFPLSSLPIVSGTYDRRLAQFAILVFFQFFEDGGGTDMQHTSGIPNATGVHRHVDDLLLDCGGVTGVAVLHQESAPVAYRLLAT